MSADRFRRRPRHSRVPVAEEFLTVDAEDLARAHELRGADLGELRGRTESASMLWMSPSSPRVAVRSTTRMPS